MRALFLLLNKYNCRYAIDRERREPYGVESDLMAEHLNHVFDLQDNDLSDDVDSPPMVFFYSDDSSCSCSSCEEYEVLREEPSDSIYENHPQLENNSTPLVPREEIKEPARIVKADEEISVERNPDSEEEFEVVSCDYQ